MSDNSTLIKQKCYHCGDECTGKKIITGDKYFCCEGCKMVYEILNDAGLCNYYELNQKPGIAQKIKIRNDKFSFLDEQAIINKLISFANNEQTHLMLYLPQMHCSSCLWLLENIHRINAGVISCRVNFQLKEVFIVFNNSKTNLRKVVEAFTSIGYEPHISLQDGEKKEIKSYNKKKLYKIGIAGFCFANIMMMSLPEYFSSGKSLDEGTASIFRYIILTLSLPILFYCASEFFVTAWQGLRKKYLNIDAPIAVAITITFIRSLYEIFLHHTNGYLDSMSGIIFFMLLGRLVQQRTYRSISFDRDFTSFFPVAVNVKRAEGFVSLPLNEIRKDDIIQVYGDEIIPADAILSKGKASIDYSFVSGETIPVQKEIGEIVYAGGKQVGEKIELIVVKEVAQSYLTGLWNKDVFKNKRSHQSFVNAISKYFTIAVFILCFAAAGYWYFLNEPIKMWNAVTTVLIVACPCALLLASTFTNGNMVRILTKNKFYVRSADVIEDLSNIDHIVFDKTGTITQTGKFSVTYNGQILSEEEKADIASLLSQSNHPLSITVLHSLNIDELQNVQHYKNHIGLGIEGWIKEKHILLGSASFVKAPVNEKSNSSLLFVKIDEQIAGCFTIHNNYRYGLKSLLTHLKKQFSVSVISGDNDAELKNIHAMLGNESEVLFNMKPDEKLSYIKHLQGNNKEKVLMIGDGLNDAGALKQSNVGIAVAENKNNFTPSCDAIIDASRFAQLLQFIQFAKSSKKIIYSSFILSVIYNVAGLFFALQGILSPLVAAILMPLSSVSIILLTYGLSNILAKKYKL